MRSPIPEPMRPKIEQALTAKGALGPCPMCEQKAHRKLQPEVSHTGGVECVLVECENCGFIALHNVKALLGRAITGP
jgi:C4-type Zn-finger protein